MAHTKTGRQAIEQKIAGALGQAATEIRTMPDTDVLSPEAAAAYTGLSLATIRRRLRDGTLPARRIGRLWRLSRPALDAFLAGAEPTSHAPSSTPNGEVDLDDGLDAILEGARRFVALIDEARRLGPESTAWLLQSLVVLDAQLRPALAQWDAVIGDT